MAYPEKHYRWTWEFRAPPRALWPLVSNTDRFNRDCGFPPFTVRPAAAGTSPVPGIRRLRSVYLGIVGEWEEREFEWVQPVRFAVDRTFSKGPLVRMIQSCELAPNAKGGTTLVYEMRVTPKNLLGALIVPAAIGFRMRKDAERALKGYDARALEEEEAPSLPRPPEPPSAGTPRLASLSWRLVSEERQPEALVRSLCAHVTDADDLSVSKMRPYALADTWGTGRRETLDLFLHATRAGMLDFSWEVLCPHCRGSRKGKADLSSVTSEAHCDSCGIDFTVNFDQSVELTFVPNPRVRKVPRLEYCLGGPQITPHVVAQKHLEPGESLCIGVSFPEGRYRMRVQGVAAQQAFRIERYGARSVTFDVALGAAPSDEPAVSPDGILNILNTGAAEHLVVIERVAWSDQSVTAAAVTSRQMFRDLFSRDLLRVGERISVGAMTIVFTDLKNSTRLYREIGDAPAFGRVLDHFDTVRAAIADEEGAIVKTMGDAVMATFTHPAAALRAMRRAQADLANPERPGAAFALKCSIHQGPCLAINQNDRLDYFGTTVNICARLCALSTGSDIIVSGSVAEDAEVAGIVANPRAGLDARPESAELRGIGGTAFEFWRVTG